MDDMFDPLGNFIKKDNSLFGDDGGDDIDSIFGDKPNNSSNSSSSSSRIKADPIFGDNDGSNDPLTTQPKPQPKVKKPAEEPKSSPLPPSTSTAATAAASKGSLFGDDDNRDDQQPTVEPKADPSPLGPPTSSRTEKKAAITARKDDDDDEEEEEEGKKKKEEEEEETENSEKMSGKGGCGGVAVNSSVSESTPLVPGKAEALGAERDARRRRWVLAGVCAAAAAAVVVVILCAILLQPATVSCNAEGNENYFVRHVAAPAFAGGADPPVVCADHANAIRLSGTGLLTIDGARPNVTLTYPQGAAFTTTTTTTTTNITESVTEYDLEGCTKLSVRGRNVHVCTGLTFSHAFPTRSDGQYAVSLSVVNPPAPRPKVVSSPRANRETCGVFGAPLLTVVPSPAATAFKPSFVCIDDENATTTTEYNFQGSFFIESKRVGGAALVPRIEVCGAQVPGEDVALSNCENLPVGNSYGDAEYEYVRACRNLRFDYNGTACTDGHYAVITVTNPDPAPCSSSSSSRIGAIRRPTVTEASPAVVCTTQGAVDVHLQGTGFATVRGAQPHVKLITTKDAYGSSSSNKKEAVVTETTGCVAVGDIGNVASCTGATVRLPKHAYTEPTGLKLQLFSPEKVCEMSAAAAVVLAAEPAPVLEAILNTSVCIPASSSSSANIVVYAHGMFTAEEGTRLAVSIGGGAEDQTTPFLTGTCRKVEAGRHVFDMCDTLGFEVVPGEAPLGELSVRVRGHCMAELPAALTLVPTPVIGAVSTQEVCGTEDMPVRVSGSNFLVLHGVPPEITFTTITNTTTNTTETYTVPAADITATGCDPANESSAYRLCTALDFEVPAGALPLHFRSELLVRNGVSAAATASISFGCPAEAAVEMNVVTTPTVTSYTQQFCENQGADVAIVGEDFFPAALAVFLVDPASGQQYPAESLLNATPTAVTARFAPGAVPAGTYNLVVQNTHVGTLCRSAAQGAPLAVHANNVELLFAEPAFILAAGVARDISVQTVGMGAEGPVWLKLIAANNNNNNNNNQGEEFFYVRGENMTYDAATGRAHITLPAGMSAKTTFTAAALAPTTCRTSSSATAPMLTVVPTTSFDIASVTPTTFSSADAVSTITVTAATEVFADEEAIPEVTLVKEASTATSIDDSNTNTNTTIAVRVGPVVRISATQVEVQVDHTVLAVDTGYTIEVAVPGSSSSSSSSGSGSRWAGGQGKSLVRVSSVVPPRITRATRLLYSNKRNVVQVVGSGFANQAFKATLYCEDFDSPLVGTDVSVASDTELSVAFTVGSSSYQETCYMDLEELGTGYPAVRYHGMYVAMQDRDLDSWSTQKIPAKVCAAAGAAYSTGGRAFVYLIGGDEDKACRGASPTKDVRIAELNEYGSLPSDHTAWRTGQALPIGIAHAAIERVEEYIYLIGGITTNTTLTNTNTNRNSNSNSNSKTTPLATVYRAHILQQSTAPLLTGLQTASKNIVAITNTNTNTNTSLAPGVHYYAVSAVYGPNDDINPGGETLRSNIFSVRVSIPTGAAATLTWDAVPDAVAYKVYRGKSPAALTHIATTAASDLTYIDANQSDITATGEEEEEERTTPLELGAIGAWHAVGGSAALSTGRYGLSTAVAALRGHSYTLFAFGGLGADGSAAKGYEITTISVKDGDPAKHKRQNQTLVLWKVGLNSVKSRAYWKAVALDSTNFGYTTEYLASIVLGPSDSSQSCWTNYVRNSDEFENKNFTETSAGFSLFGYCGFIFDKALYIAGGTNNMDTFTPVLESAHLMQLE